MLGIVTEVTVKLVPKPQVARVIMASFDDVVKGGNAVANVIAAGIIPAGLEMMDKTSSRMVEPFVKAGYDINAEAILLCESDGTTEEVEEEIARMSAVLEQAGATAIAVSQSEAERLRLVGRKCVSRSGTYIAGLLLHGWNDSSEALIGSLDRHHSHGRKIRFALRKRVSCRRR
jgi:glycolate oxidase